MSDFEAVVLLSWELPFPLRLPAAAIFIWEPTEGLSLFDPRPSIGELEWHRTSGLLSESVLYGALPKQADESYPLADYRTAAISPSGDQFFTAQLLRGPNGGFREIRPYTLANLFLVLGRRDEYKEPEVVTRASEAINNLLDVYRFVTMDPLIRRLSPNLDAYYLLRSVADLPSEFRTMDPRRILEHVGEMSFGHVIGVNRSHTVGVNHFEDLYPGGPLPDEHLDLLVKQSQRPHRMELFHHLILSAIRRIKRGEEALAVLDAQSAFEAFVASLVFEALRRVGKTTAQIETLLGTRFNQLQRRLEFLDTLTSAGLFLGSPAEIEWRRSLYRLRNQVVHEGLRNVSFSSAKTAIGASLKAIDYVQSLSTDFKRTMQWSGEILDLKHVQLTAGRLTRMFET